MANSLLDYGNIAQIAQGNLRNAMAMKQMSMQEEQLGMRQSQMDLDREKMELDERKLRQNSTFKAFDEMEKLAKSPQFATPQMQTKLRVSQANLIKMGLGIEMPMPSEQELIGNTEEFAENLKLIRNGADPETRGAAFERMAISMPDFGHGLLTTLKQENELSAQSEALLTKLELNKAKLQALNLKAGRATMQQGLFSENMGAIAQTVSVANHPKFQAHLTKLQGMSEPARQVYLKMNPQFEQEFKQAMQPHLEKLGAVGPEFEEALGEDVKPRFLAALDQEIDARLQTRQEAAERDGVPPAELSEELSGFEIVRKARTMQYAWMRDPFNKEKYQAMLKAQQNIKLAHDAAGKTLSSIQNERLGIAQAKFDAGQQEKLASDYAQEMFHQKLKEGHDENDAVVLAGKAVAEKYPNTPYNADKLKTHKPLVENKNEVKYIEKADGALGNNMADHIAKQIDTSHKAALNAYDTLDGVERIRTALDTNKVTLGPGATLRNSGNQILQMLGMGGKDTAERLSNTRAVMQELARFTLKARTQLRGEGNITEGEQKVAELAESGKIDDFTVPDIRTLLSAAEKQSRRTYERHQKTLATAKDNPVAKHLIPFYEIDPLPPPRAEQPKGTAKTQPGKAQAQPQAQEVPSIKSDADFNKLPSGSIFIGPDGKKRRKP